MRPISVLVVDDHPVVLSGLVALLSSQGGFSVVATASDAAGVRGIEPDEEPGVCIIDLRLPDGDGVEVGREVKQRWPTTKVLILTMHEDPAAVVRALGAGLDGYLLKDAEPAELVSAVRAVAEGAIVLGRAASRPVIAAAAALPEANPIARLDVREVEILSLLVDGCSVAEIAERLHYAPKTIRNRVTQLTAKLGAEDRAEAIAIGLAAGLGQGPRNRIEER